MAYYSILPHSKDPDNFNMHSLVKFDWEMGDKKAIPSKLDIEEMKERFK